jgi:hypothetical protein
MSDCYSTGSGAQLGLRIETTASSFFALPYHQLERVDFSSADGTDTVIVSFVSCTIRIIGKGLHMLANYIVKQEADLVRVTPKGSLPPATDSQRREIRESARIDKIEVAERKEQAE